MELFNCKVKLNDYTESEVYDKADVTITDNEITITPIHQTKFSKGELVVNHIGVLGRILEIVSAKRELYRVQWIYGNTENCCNYDMFEIDWDKENK